MDTGERLLLQEQVSCFIEGKERSLVATLALNVEEGVRIKLFDRMDGECVDYSKFMELADALTILRLVGWIRRLRVGYTLTDLAAAIEDDIGDDPARLRRLADDLGVWHGDVLRELPVRRLLSEARQERTPARRSLLRRLIRH